MDLTKTPPNGDVAILESVHPRMADDLKALGFVPFDASSITRNDIITGQLRHVSGVVVRSRFLLDEELQNAMPALRFIARSGSGLENIDVEAATRLGIAVLHSPEGNAAAVGEHVVGMMLNVLNRMREADLSVRAGLWERESHRGLELGCRKVGIVGFGHMGQAVAQRLTGFSCEVLAYDKYKAGFNGEFGVQEASLETLHAQADLVTIHVPLNAETHGMMDDNWFQAWAKPIFLIQAARGPILKTSSLLRAMDRGQVLGAALDVVEHEGRDLLGLSEQPDAWLKLLQHPRTLFTPHVAGWTEESLVKLSTVLIDKIADLGLR
ncbi:MAG: NAD(P)-dependent oxidoreductase [Flavobacteriales bacterium]